ncbi:MAG TPA: CHAT domain-containing protein [Acidobacteriota bacterium]|nr:CHAT domain-containing protein [Acidobacteriota bacterium]
MMNRFVRGSWLVCGIVLIGWILTELSEVPSVFGFSQPVPFTQAQELVSGQPIRVDFKGGEKKVFQLRLQVNQYLDLVVDQQGIDVVVRLKSPDGTLQFEADSPNGTRGLEEIWFVSGTAGEYQVEVESTEPSAAPGQFEVTVKTLRSATTTDRVEAEINWTLHQIQVLFASNRIPDALKTAETAIKHGEASLPPDHQLIALAYQELGNLHQVMGKPKEAETATLKALAMFEKTLGPTHEDLVVPLNLLGLLADGAGNFAKAETYLSRAMEIVDHNPNIPEANRATTWNNVALVNDHKGNVQQAEVMYLKALASFEKVNGVDSLNCAPVLNNLGLLYHQQGAFLKAEQYYARSIAIRKKYLAPGHPSIGFILNNLADMYTLRSDWKQAIRYQTEAISILEKVFGEKHPQTILFHLNLGEMLVQTHDYEAAVLYYRKAITNAESTLGPTHPYYLIGLAGLAGFQLKTSQLSQAEATLTKALPLIEKVFGPTHPRLMMPLFFLAQLNQRQRKYQEAEAALLRAISIQEKNTNVRFTEPGMYLSALSYIYQMSGKIEPALAYEMKSNDVVEQDFLKNISLGSERQKVLYLNRTKWGANHLLALQAQYAPHNQAAINAAVTSVLRRKGRALDVMADTLRLIQARATAQDQAIFEKLIDAQNRLSNLTVKGPGTTKPERFQALVQELETEVDQLEAEISRQSAEYRVQTQPVTLENIQAAIPEHTALIEFTLYQPLQNAQSSLNTKPRYLAYIIEPKGDPKWVDLGEVEKIDATTKEFRGVLQQSPGTRNRLIKAESRNAKKSNSGSVVLPDQQLRVLAQSLHQTVIKPVLKMVKPGTALLLAPEGELNLVPFAALMDEDGTYLIEKQPLHYLTSGRDLLRLQVKTNSHEPPLVVADPDYAVGSGPQVAGIQLAQLKRLIETAQEGVQIAKILPGSRLKVRGEATEQALKQVNGPQILHVATHGYFLDRSSDVTLSADPIEEAEKRDIQIKGSGTKLDLIQFQSGIFLAGANRGESGTEDGTLTALEAAHLNLSGTKLVVLSACNTGVGQVKTGEGVYGLRRAMVLAGSETQMLSLWPVSDLGTRKLMVDYYTRLKAGEGRAEALRQVQLEMLKSRRFRHPYYWASFVVSGEWSSPGSIGTLGVY